MSFFRNMNLARGIIFFSLLGSLVLGYVAWGQKAEIEELKVALKSTVPNIVNDIQRNSLNHTRLTRAVKKEGLTGKDKLESYILACRDKPEVEIGQVSLDPSTDFVTGEIVDKKYRIRPKDAGRSFPRSRIAAFLYRLETDSRRVKVTNATIELADKKTKPHEIPEDRWSFDVEVTSRQATE